MNSDRVFQTDFGEVCELLLNKVTRKGWAKAKVDEVICWLTRYSPKQLEAFRSSGLCCGDFFRNAPQPNPNRALIKGVVCGIRMEAVEVPLMQEIRCLDKLIDEPAKRKPMEKILRCFFQAHGAAERHARRTAGLFVPCSLTGGVFYEYKLVNVFNPG